MTRVWIWLAPSQIAVSGVHEPFNRDVDGEPAAAQQLHRARRRSTSRSGRTYVAGSTQRQVAAGQRLVQQVGLLRDNSLIQRLELEPSCVLEADLVVRELRCGGV